MEKTKNFHIILAIALITLVGVGLLVVNNSDSSSSSIESSDINTPLDTSSSEDNSEDTADSSSSSDESSTSSDSSSSGTTFNDGFADGVNDAYNGIYPKYTYDTVNVWDNNEYQQGYADGYESYLSSPHLYSDLIR